MKRSASEEADGAPASPGLAGLGPSATTAELVERLAARASKKLRSEVVPPGTAMSAAAPAALATASGSTAASEAEEAKTDVDDAQSWCDEDDVAQGEAQSVSQLIARARAAQRVLETYGQERVDTLIRGMVWAVCKPGTAEKIARLCVDETRLGDYEGKLAKIAKKTRAGLLDIVDERSVGVVAEDPARGLVKIAKPVGVVGATSPSTNPEATPVLKAINAIKGRNAIVISPHPRAERTNAAIVRRMRRALRRLGAPEDLVLHVAQPTRAKTEALMAACDLVWATGGQNIARRALASGTPSYASGVGNAVVLVDDTADLAAAASCIRRSKTFDLAASCSSDNAVLAFDAVYDALLDKLRAEGGHVIDNAADRNRLSAALFKPPHKPGAGPVLNPDVVVQSAQNIAAVAGIQGVPPSATFFVVPETGVGPDHPFSGEKLSVVLAYFRVADVADAVQLTNAIQKYQGAGHSCGVHSACEENIMTFASQTRTARVMVNQPQSLSNSGSLQNGMPVTLSLGCGTWGGCTATDNINWRQCVNLTWVSRPLGAPKQLPPDEELFRGVTEATSASFSSSAATSAAAAAAAPPLTTTAGATL